MRFYAGLAPDQGAAISATFVGEGAHHTIHIYSPCALEGVDYLKTVCSAQRKSRRFERRSEDTCENTLK